MLVRFALLLLTTVGVGSALAQQTPCEEVRSTLAVNVAEVATQVRTLERENAALKAKLATLEKPKTETPK
jgi:hypothetical protein